MTNEPKAQGTPYTPASTRDSILVLSNRATEPVYTMVESLSVSFV